ncbi:reticulon-4 receptor-like 2 [Platysternon megacephalum]|uniref:Reticulon-4 receptor-like 2 n=1 Tax=Platysternon megacephalum TaxID=55544 RepID=A0A4D9DU99_9SAUR|nr:reticulon-4 receptor-like 2 [Platysternon megacephalum]
MLATLSIKMTLSTARGNQLCLGECGLDKGAWPGGQTWPTCSTTTLLLEALGLLLPCADHIEGSLHPPLKWKEPAFHHTPQGTITVSIKKGGIATRAEECPI